MIKGRWGNSKKNIGQLFQEEWRKVDPYYDERCADFEYLETLCIKYNLEIKQKADKKNQ